MSSERWSIGDYVAFTAAVCMICMPVYIIYMDTYYWGPKKAAELVEAAKHAAIVAEAKKVEVSNKVEPKAEAGKKRFSAEFYGEFTGGFQDNKRSIFIVKDSQTGVEYLAITGCGVSELRTEQYTVQQGKSTVTKTRTVEE